MSLPLKTNAYIVFSGNANGGTVSMQLSDIGYTALSVGPLNPMMTQGLQVAEGTLTYISADRLQSGIVFTTSTCDSGVVKMFFSINGVIVAVFTGDGFTSDFVPTVAMLKFDPSTPGLTTAEILRGIQSLGGSEGYQKYLATSNQARNSTSITVTPKINEGWSTIAVRLYLRSGSFYTSLLILSVDGHMGRGFGWAGANMPESLSVVGMLHHADWKKLESAENNWEIVAPGASGLIHFTINNELVAWLSISGPAVGINETFKPYGKLTWTNA